MTARILLISALCLSPVAALAQAQIPDVLVDGNPPLTQEMVADYTHFMQWALRTPLTVAQEQRIKNYLVTSWKAGDLREITRSVDLLALRDRLSTMQLQDSYWAATSTGHQAYHYWNQNPTTASALWGLAIYRATHTSLLPDKPPLNRQMEDAYEEFGYFMMNVVDGAAPVRIDAVSRMQLADTLAGAYKTMTPDQKTNFSNLPQVWYQIRTAWPTLDDTTKNSLKTMWKSRFFPQPTKTKGSKVQQAPPATPEQPLIRLAKMTWVTSPDVFAKMSAVGTPYTNGW